MTIKRKGHSWVNKESNETLDAWFPENIEDPQRACLAEKLGLLEGKSIEIEIDIDSPPKDTADVWLRLHLLSQRQYKPHEINLDSIFGLLVNIAWTNAGPVLPDRVEELIVAAAGEGESINVNSVDKFPRMTDYVVPSGVRMANANRVRLGAHLADGTTIMHEGFVNFNAGTLGASMVEGRISAGVSVGDGSDIGGGASIMGTLSGGGEEVISIGKNCLVGANGGTGISLGDHCVVEAGLYVTAGSYVKMPDGENLKASELSGTSGLLFRRNSMTGQIEVLLSDKTDWGGINEDLHKN